MSSELEKHQAALDRLDRYATLMDAQFQIPGTRFRFGLDPIIGLLPGIGDAIGLLGSLYVVVEAIRLDASRRLLIGMLGNIGVEFLVGAVPVFGDLFDASFKANLRNTRLLRSYLESRTHAAPPQPHRRWKLWALLTLFAGVALMFLLIILAALAYLLHLVLTV